VTSDARPTDVASPKAIVNAVYEIISGRAEEARDWDRWRTLYAPGARLIPIERDREGRLVPSVFDPEEYVESRTPMLAANDFFEWETGYEERRSGSIVHVWSSYDAARTQGGEVIRRGVNSILLWNDGSRWWILSEAWDAVNAEAMTNSG
jgi:hypothetical protein